MAVFHQQWVGADKTVFSFLRFSFVLSDFLVAFIKAYLNIIIWKILLMAAFHQQWVCADKAIDNFLSHLLDFAARTFSTLFVNVKTHRRDFQQEFIYWKKNRFLTKKYI